MNIQEIVVLVIVAIAVFFAVRKLVRKVQDPVDCGSCSSDSCNGCELTDLRKNQPARAKDPAEDKKEIKKLNS